MGDLINSVSHLKAYLVSIHVMVIFVITDFDNFLLLSLSTSLVQDSIKMSSSSGHDIYRYLPPSIQIICVSATMNPDVLRSELFQNTSINSYFINYFPLINYTPFVYYQIFPGFSNELKRSKMRFLAPKAPEMFGILKIINYTPLVYYNIETRGGIVDKI